MDKKNRGLKIVLGLNIDEFCQRHGYTNDTLATELDVSRATVFNWKKDTRNLPRLVVLALYALEFDPKLRKTNRKSEIRPTKQYRRSSYATNGE